MLILTIQIYSIIDFHCKIYKIRIKNIQYYSDLNVINKINLLLNAIQIKYIESN